MSLLGLPVSASHALVADYAGSAMSRLASLEGLGRSLDAVILKGWIEPVLFIFLPPLLGLVPAGALMVAVYWLFSRSSPQRTNGWFRKLQLVSAAAFSYAHGTNDARRRWASSPARCSPAAT